MGLKVGKPYVSVLGHEGDRVVKESGVSTVENEDAEDEGHALEIELLRGFSTQKLGLDDAILLRNPLSRRHRGRYLRIWKHYTF